MDSRDRSRLTDAFGFAVAAHGEQTRKGRDVPYVSHLAQVAGLVLEYGGDPQQAMAGLLHDVLEDCDVDPAVLRERFGDDVADMVERCTDLVPGDSADAKSPWQVRKRRYLAQIAEACARTRLVAACDKLHNLRCLTADLRLAGPATLERFSASGAQMRWYYESIRGVLGEDLPRPLLDELDDLLVTLARQLPGAPAEDPGKAP